MPKYVNPKKMHNRLVCGDSAKVLERVPDGSVDLIVTDPPWSYSFMGKDWDKALPPIEIWEECLRVLKPGAFAFVQCGPRQDCLARMIIQLEDAGFVISTTSLYHCFAQGFPKAQNLSKAADRAAGVEREVVGFSQHHSENRKKHNWMPDGLERERLETRSSTPEAKALDGAFAGAQFKPAIEVILVAMKPLAPLKRSDVRAATGWDYYYTREIEVYPKNRKRLEKKFGRKLKAHKGKTKGDVIVSRLALNPELTDQVILNGKTVLQEKPYRDAKLSNYLTQALVNGHGCTWLDDARIPTAFGDSKSARFGHENKKSPAHVFGPERIMHKEPDGLGRFPANLLVSDNAIDDGSVRKTGNIKPHQRANPTFCGGPFATDVITNHQGDSGSFSRYFSLDSWWTKRIKHLPPTVQKTFPFMIVPKASTSEKNKGLTDAKGQMDQGRRKDFSNPFNRGGEQRRNTHPTTKPVALISYLIILGSRKGDLVMDPFNGSGTTTISAKLLGRKYFGIEREREYFEISQARMRGNTWAGRLLLEDSEKRKRKKRKKRKR